VDTHAEVHVAAVADRAAHVLGAESFPATGAGLARYLTVQDVEVAEVIRPNRQARRRRGKSDSTEAVAAAPAALNGDASGTPKAHDGAAEAGPYAAGRPPNALGRRSDQFRQGARSAWATGVRGECAPLRCRLCTARGRWLVRAGDGSHRGPLSGRSVVAGPQRGQPSPSIAAMAAWFPWLQL